MKITSLVADLYLQEYERIPGVMNFTAQFDGGLFGHDTVHEGNKIRRVSVGFTVNYGNNRSIRRFSLQESNHELPKQANYHPPPTTHNLHEDPHHRHHSNEYIK